MKKVKLQMLGLSVNDLLSREQMKKVMGGSGGGSGAGGCTTSADCAAGEGCIKGLPGHDNFCQAVSVGTSCSSDSDCGRGQTCVSKPVGTGKWCNT